MDGSTALRNTLDGEIKIINEIAIIKDPINNGRKAKIHPHPDLIIKVNEQEILRETPVTKEDTIEMIKKEDKGKRTLDIKIGENKLKAYGRIHYENVKLIKIKDREGVNSLTPEVEIIEKPPKAYTYDEIINELKAMKIVYGIEKEAINSLIENPAKEKLIVRGKIVTKGTDGYIEYLFHGKDQRVDLEDVNSKINYRDTFEVPSVKKGELIGERTPPVYGRDGVNIYGKPIKAPRVKDPVFVPGKNVEIDNQGLKIYSLIDGKPCVRGQIVNVFSLHEVIGDVDIKSGNIDFSGDVVIKGNVTEGMKIKSGHNITIKGSVSGASLEACGEVFIEKWAFNSTIISGNKQTELKRLHSYFSKFQSSILNLLSGSIEVLKKIQHSDESTLPTGKIMSLVMDKHFKDIPDQIKDLKGVKKEKLPSVFSEEIHKDIDYLSKKYSAYGVLKIKNIEEVKEDILFVGYIMKKLESLFKEPMNITIPYIQNSNIQASGNLILTGQGCLNSTVFAGESVFMSENRGTTSPCVFRGGKLQCNKDIKLNEIGSSGGALTEIYTGKNGKVLFNFLYYNTHIQIGEAKKKIEETVERGICFRNKKGEVILKSIKLD